MAGLTTAWLLQNDHDVMLFERQRRLGGHAQMIDVDYGGRTVTVDVAAEFFGDARSYPLFHRLLAHLPVPTRSFAMTATVYDNESGRKLVLPPWRRGTIDWSMLSMAAVRDLLRFANFSTTVANSDEATLRSETIGAFLARIPSEDFCREMLFPFLIGQFGMPRAAFDDCLAYDILKYCTLAGPIRLSAPAMTEVVGGTRAYIGSLAKALSPRRISTGVSIERIEVENRKMLCHLAGGQCYWADHVVLATGIADVGRLYPAGETGDTVRNVMSTVDTFEAEIAIHGDASIMPRDRASWSTFARPRKAARSRSGNRGSAARRCFAAGLRVSLTSFGTKLVASGFVIQPAMRNTTLRKRRCRRCRAAKTSGSRAPTFQTTTVMKAR
jgi:predicted NAD/FAD-binding protein